MHLGSIGFHMPERLSGPGCSDDDSDCAGSDLDSYCDGSRDKEDGADLGYSKEPVDIKLLQRTVSGNCPQAEITAMLLLCFVQDHLTKQKGDALVVRFADLATAYNAELAG